MVFLLRDKNLIRTVNHPVFRFETGVDDIKILIPKTEKLVNSIPVVEISMPINDKGEKGFFYTKWKYDEESYKEDYLSLTIPIKSQLTQFAGIIEIWVMCVDIQLETDEEGNDKNYAKLVMKSFPSSFEVLDSGSSDSATERDFEELWYHTTIDALQDVIDKIITYEYDPNKDEDIFEHVED